ncbi:MAG: HDIG domain-containing protein [archaeon]|nr:HDIG domain-containing protein [archaeon]MCP8320277.1 HDIG domain-containing protein [archaeon]
MNEQEAINLLKKEKSPEALVKHSMTVSEVSNILALALKEKGYDIDLELVRVGGLLHDVGRVKVHSVHHGYLGGKLLREMGIDERVARIAERHVGGGISSEEAKKLGLPERRYMPESLEEKVVCFADKIVEIDHVIPLEKTLDKLREELGYESSSVQRLIELKDELTRLLNRDPEEIVKESIIKELR